MDLKLYFLRFMRSSISQSLLPVTQLLAVGQNATIVSSGFFPVRSKSAWAIDSFVIPWEQRRSFIAFNLFPWFSRFRVISQYLLLNFPSITWHRRLEWFWIVFLRIYSLYFVGSTSFFLSMTSVSFSQVGFGAIYFGFLYSSLATLAGVSFIVVDDLV